MSELIGEMTFNVITDVIALPQGEHVFQKHFADLGRPVRLVYTRDPIVTPPVSEQVRVVKSEDVDVRPVHEVVRQNADVATGVVRPDDTYERWIVAF